MENSKHRESFEFQMQLAKERKEKADNGTEQCEHDWHKFKKTIQSDNPDYKYSRAYFVVKGCIKCKEKVYLNMVVEN